MSAAAETALSSAGLATSAAGIVSPSLPTRQGVFLSDVIVELGFAEREAVEKAVQTAASSGKPVDRQLLDSGILDEQQLSIAVAERNGLARVDLDRFEIDPSAAALIGRSAAARYNALPIAFSPEGALVVAVADPSDFLGISDIEVMARAEVRLVIASLNKIQARIDGLPDEPAPLAALQIEEEGADAAERNGDLVEIATATAAHGGGHGNEELNQIRQELVEAADECERLRQEEERRGKEADELRAEVERLDGEGGQLREELVAAKGERDRLREEADRLRGKLELAEGERESLAAEMQRIKSEAVERASMELPSPTSADAPLSLGNVALDEERGTATIPIQIGSAGTISLSGKGVERVSSVQESACDTSLEVRPTEKKKKKLQETGKAKLLVEISFMPVDGAAHTRTIEVRVHKRRPRSGLV
jgi:MshEN domain